MMVLVVRGLRRMLEAGALCAPCVLCPLVPLLSCLVAPLPLSLRFVFLSSMFVNRMCGAGPAIVVAVSCSFRAAGNAHRRTVRLLDMKRCCRQEFGSSFLLSGDSINQGGQRGGEYRSRLDGSL